jgi:hypothetical protein
MTTTRFSLRATLMGISVLAVGMLMLGGCSSGEDTSSSDAVPPPAPRRHHGAPVRPGSHTASVDGRTTQGPGGPRGHGAPAAGAKMASATKPAAPTDPMHLPIERAPLKSSIKHLTVKSGGTSIDYLKFTYRDYDGSTAYCEMPSSEAKQPRSADEWVTTFSTYKQEPPAKVVKKKVQKQPESPDYPFVSPRGSGE